MESIWSPLADGQPVRAYGPGQLIYLQGTDATYFYYIVSGQVRSFLSSADGGERVLTIHREGDLMGEASFFDQCPRVSSAAAVTESRVAFIDRARLETVFAQRPDLALPMLQYLARTVRMLSAHVDDITFRPAPQRLARYLLEQFERGASLSLTHEELGCAVGLSRVTVSRVLGELSAMGILSTGYRTVTLLDYNRLAALAGNR